VAVVEVVVEKVVVVTVVDSNSMLAG